MHGCGHVPAALWEPAAVGVSVWEHSTVEGWGAEALVVSHCRQWDLILGHGAVLAQELGTRVL